ncbi:hypothetical protein NBRC116493_29090 [Aurantivibrio infirmus]
MHIIVLLVVIVGVIYLLNRSAAVFQLTVENGEITKTKGNISNRLISEFETALSKHDQGKIIASKSSRDIRLSFSGNMNEFTQQRIRNIFGIYKS